MTEAELIEGRPKARWKIAVSDDFRQALPRMLAFRGMNREALGWKMGKGLVCRTIFNGFLSKQKQDVKLSSFLEAMEAMDFDVYVVPKTGKAERARAALLAERQQFRAEQAAQAEQQQFAEQGRDSTGRLKVLTAEQQAEAEALLEKYGSLK